jgi:hypothetical protein
MSVAARIFLAIYSLILIAAAVGFAVLAWNDEQMLDVGVGDLSLQALFETDNASAERWALTAILALVVLIGVFTLFLALWRRGSRGEMQIEQDDGTVVEITPDAVESLLRDEIERLPEVRQAVPTVRFVKNAVDSHVSVVVEPSATISQVSSAVTQVTTRVLRDEIGVTKLRRPVVRIGYDEIAARPVARQGRVKPQAANEPVIGETGAEPVVAAPPASGDGERRDWQDQG